MVLCAEVKEVGVLGLCNFLLQTIADSTKTVMKTVSKMTTTQ